MRAAIELLREIAPDLQVDGEMQADLALSEELRSRIFPRSHLTGQANLLVCPGLDAANIAMNLARVVAEGITVGPMLMGMARPAHVVHNAITARGLVNMTAISVVEAQALAAG